MELFSIREKKCQLLTENVGLDGDENIITILGQGLNL
jgi:hypothetical protein